MAGDDETKKRILTMYGEKLVNRLLEAWEKEKENEEACQTYLKENTVRRNWSVCGC